MIYKLFDRTSYALPALALAMVAALGLSLWFTGVQRSRNQKVAAAPSVRTMKVPPNSKSMTLSPMPWV